MSTSKCISVHAAQLYFLIFQIDPTIDMIKFSVMPVLKKFFIDDESLSLKMIKRGMFNCISATGEKINNRVVQNL